MGWTAPSSNDEGAILGLSHLLPLLLIITAAALFAAIIKRFRGHWLFIPYTFHRGEFDLKPSKKDDLRLLLEIGLEPSVLERDGHYGLEWRRGLFSTEPTWTVEPDMDIITDLSKKYIALGLPDYKPVITSVEFLARGAFNRTYCVKTTVDAPPSMTVQAKTGLVRQTLNYEFIFRVSLPVNPFRKTLSECATLSFLDQHTSFPVAGVLASKPSAYEDNPLRFEWILQTRMPGMPLEALWNSFGDSGQEHVVRQLAELQAELFELQFSAIGSLYPAYEGHSAPFSPVSSVQVGPIGTVAFFKEDRLSLPGVSKGPFMSSIEWLQAQLELVQAEQWQIAKKLEESKSARKIGRIGENLDGVADKQSNNNGGSDGSLDSDSDLEDSIEETTAITELVGRLLRLLPIFFPGTSPDTIGKTILFHQDLSQRNIFVDDRGNISAILDWENTACIPTWAACNFPSLLRGKPWTELPDPKTYSRGAEDPLYKDRLLMFQQTRLRKVFLSHMKSKSPRWIRTFESSERLRDIRRAVDLCDFGIAWSRIMEWLDVQEDTSRLGDYVPLGLQ